MKQACQLFGLLLLSHAITAQTPPGSPVAALPLVRHWESFTDPNEGSFQLEMPAGWKDTGGLARRNALQYRAWASAISPDGLTILAINDPNEPSYVMPSQLMAAAGLRVGSLYNGGGNTMYLVEPYLNGAQYAASWGQRQLQSLCTDAQVTGSRARPDLAQQIDAFTQSLGIRYDYGEATFSCSRNGIPMSAWVLAGVVALGSAPGSIWYAQTLHAFLAPKPVAGFAAGLLAHMVGSFRATPSWIARQQQTNSDVSRIATQTNAAISKMIVQGFEERGAAMNRSFEEGSRARLGIDVYADQATGTQYTLEDKHRYYWSTPGGKIVGTETADPPAPGYTQMKRVPPQ